MSRKRTMALVVAGLLACLALTFDVARAGADQPLTVKPAVYQTGDSVNGGASVQLVRHWHGGYGYGYGGWGGGYRGGYWGGYYGPVYRPYPVYAAPVIAPPVYSAPVYGYPAYGYPAYGYGYGRCW